MSRSKSKSRKKGAGKPEPSKDPVATADPDESGGEPSEEQAEILLVLLEGYPGPAGAGVFQIVQPPVEMDHVPPHLVQVAVDLSQGAGRGVHRNPS